MKYLNFFEAKITNVDKKIELIRILSLDLNYSGVKTKLYNGGFGYRNHIQGKSNQICLLIEDINKILEFPIYNSTEILEFEGLLKSHNINYRIRGGGDDFIIYTFDKHGKMTDSDSWKNL